MAKKTIIGEDGKTYEMKEKKPIYKRPWFIVLAVLVVLWLLGSALGGGDNNNNNSNVATTTETKEEGTPEEKPAQEEKKDYELTDVKVTEPDTIGTVYVTGILKNNTDKDKSYVQVDFPVYDTDGNKLGSAFDNISDLKAGGTWNFKAMVLESSDQEIDVKIDEVDVTGF